MERIESFFRQLLGASSSPLIILVLAAFFLGALPTGYLIGRLWGVDVRKHGSGNIGATNVQRSAGKTAALLTLAGDILKGALAVNLISLTGAQQAAPLSPALLGFCAIAGHCYSPFLAFHGGKGVATALGVFSFLAPAVTFFAVMVFAVLVAATRYVSLGSIAAAWAVPIVCAIKDVPGGVLQAGAAAAILITLRHRANIGRLFGGTENRLGQRRTNQ